jgi:NAD-dependent deacetylase
MKIIAFTGAGISKSAGIPTFEEVPGLKEKLSLEYKNAHPEEFENAKNTMIETTKDKEPTKAHKILAQLQIPVITMNIDNLHRKAGSEYVLELHGNYIADNIVLYGQEMHYAQEATTLIMKTAREAKEQNEDAIMLVIGTSMQTAFAHILVWLAESRGMKVLYIDKDADEQVQEFFELYHMI